MPENLMPGPVCDLSSVRESVCVHTRKIFDSCRDKDCVEDLRFYPTVTAQGVLSTSQMIKGGTAELLYIYTDVEPVTFNRGFYSIDMRFFYRVTLQVCTGTPRYTEAQDQSHQVFRPVMVGNAQCFGHVQCDSIIMGQARIESVPAITANCPDAQLIHEAAIGKIAGDQLLKLETLGLTEEEAEDTILKGFLA